MKVLAGLSVLVALVLAAPAAAAPFKHVDTGATLPVASPTGEFVAYLKAPGKVVVRGEPGGRSVREVPEECVPAAASTRSVALDCYDTLGNLASVLVDDVVTGATVRIARSDLPTDGPIGVPQDPRAIDVGRHWVHLTASGAPGPGGHENTDEFLVNLDTRKVIDLASDPFGADRLLNLNRTPPARRLCTAAKRHRGGGGAFAQARFGVARGFGRWVLAATSDIAYDLVDCRTNKHRTFRSADVPPLLNANHLVTVKVNDKGVYEVVVTRLHPRATQRLAVGSASAAAPQIALSEHVLWVVNAAGDVLKRRL